MRTTLRISIKFLKKGGGGKKNSMFWAELSKNRYKTAFIRKVICGVELIDKYGYSSIFGEFLDG